MELQSKRLPNRPGKSPFGGTPSAESECMDQDLRDQAASVIARLGEAFASGDADRAADLFGRTCYWRDLLAFTWNIRTFEGRDQIRETLASRLPEVGAAGIEMDESFPVKPTGDGFEAWFRFETGAAHGRGCVRTRNGRIWTLFTAAEALRGHPESVGRNRPNGVEHHAVPGRLTWLEEREREAAELGYSMQPYVVIVGGGQAGTMLGARLRRLSVPTIVLEKQARPGDSWRRRYKTLCLHDPVWYDHFPYIPFPPNWPVFAPKDRMADWIAAYADLMEINCWCGAECRSAQYDDSKKEWAIRVGRNGEETILRPKHLVLATGMSGYPRIPEFAGMERFRGDTHHSSQHPGPDEYAGKSAVVIGANNSAHDIASALWEAGAQVAIVQRSSTLVTKSDALMEFAWGPLYSEDALERGITTEKADLVTASTPYAALGAAQKTITDAIRRRDAAFYERLSDAGFLLDFGEDETGLAMKYLRRGSGYYIDVGASQLVIDGKIRVESGRGIAEITEDSVVLEDGTRLAAELIVFATGYSSMNGFAADLISQKVADAVGKCWGLGSGTAYDPGPWEGELRNMWKPTRQEGLWFHGGNLHQSRHYSLILALQLKARFEGIPTPVYGMQPVHHLE